MTAAATLPRLRMPAHYGLFVVTAAGGFAIVIAALCILYGWLIWSGISPFLHFDFQNGTVTVPGAITRIVLGLLLLLLTWRTLRSGAVWPGIEVEKGSCPPLEDLVASCAARAGVTVPDAIYLTPDSNIAAFSAGLVRGGGGHANFINIGALMLPVLSCSDLEAAVFHEFAHLVMRRDQWSVNFDNRIRDFVPRLRSLNRRSGKIFFITVSIGRIVLLWYWYLFNLLLAPLRRREELLADDFAAACCGHTDYSRHLTCLMTLQQTLDGGLTDQINGSFHAALLGMEEADRAEHFPNWFAVARAAFREPVMEQLGAALKFLREDERQKLLDEHPTLNARLARQGGAPPASLQDLLTTEDPLAFDPAWERLMSAAFADRMRSLFYEAKLRAGMPVAEGLTASSAAAYRCCFKSCPRCGQTHLVLSCRSLRWYFQDGSVEETPWEAFSSVRMLPQGTGAGKNGPWMAWILAMYWNLPSLDDLQLTWQPLPDGRASMRRLQLFHFGENMQEAQDLTEALWARSRRVAAATPQRNLAVLLGELRNALEGESGKVAAPEAVTQQIELIKDAYQKNVGQIRWREFARLLAIYEALLERAQDQDRWHASASGRRVVLEQLEKRQSLRNRIAGMGYLKFIGQILWLPVWGRVAFIAGAVVSIADLAYFAIAWRNNGSPPLLQFANSIMVTNTWFHLSVLAGVVFLSAAAGGQLRGISVMEDVDLTAFRAFNSR